MDPVRRIVPFLLLPSFLLVAPMSQAAILRVSQTGDGSDGATWETAFQSICDALTASASGDRIWVASGTYNESVTMVPGVSLFGGFRGNEAANEFSVRDWKANRTIINPKGLNKRCVTGTDNVVIDGFSITGARLDGEHAGFGGGILCRSNMIVRNCDIYGNYVGCDTEPVFCFSGGGISAPSADNVLISNCFIRDNVALGEGGGISMTDFSLPYDNTVIIENSVIDRNFGSGILSLSVVLVIRNCTFGPNNTNDGEPEDIIIRIPPGVPGRFLNCIFTKEIFDSDADVRFSCIPGTAGEENIDADPLWVDPENGDYHLRIDSPCIDSGTDTGLTVDLDGNPRPVDVIGTGFDGPGAYDMGAYEFQLSPADLDSNGYVNSRDLILFQDRWQDSE